jgi:hypothetical protein
MHAKKRELIKSGFIAKALSRKRQQEKSAGGKTGRNEPGFIRVYSRKFAA